MIVCDTRLVLTVISRHARIRGGDLDQKPVARMPLSDPIRSRMQRAGSRGLSMSTKVRMSLSASSAKLRRLSANLGSVPTVAYLLLYLLLVPAFALVYSVLPWDHFWHSTSKFEYGYFEQDANSLLEGIREQVVDAFKSHYGRSRVSFDGWEVDIESVRFHSLDVANFPDELGLQATIPVAYDTQDGDYVHGWLPAHITIPLRQTLTIDDVVYLFPTFQENHTIAIDGTTAPPEPALIFPSKPEGALVYSSTMPISGTLYADIIRFGRGHLGFPAGVSGQLVRMLYLSATIVTSNAMGDIVPLTTTARTLTTLESLCAAVLVGLFLNALAYDVAHLKKSTTVTNDDVRGGASMSLEEIGTVVEGILDRHTRPWPRDITDKVFLEIERDQRNLQRYSGVVAELDRQGKKGQQIVNQYIGKLVKLLTTGVNRGRCYSPRSSLIKSYERH
jgi:hypothetical protein